MSETHPTRWRGVNATYSYDERQIQRQLKTKEQWFIHLLKAHTDGEISSSADSQTCPVDLPEREMSGQGAPVYTDPEELEFGKPKRKRPIYALVCTWKQSCVVPTKREGEFWMKVWKAWYEHQGWKVKSHDTGYFAAKGEERHAIGLDEYDRVTHERFR